MLVKTYLVEFSVRCGMNYVIPDNYCLENSAVARILSEGLPPPIEWGDFCLGVLRNLGNKLLLECTI